MWERIRSLHLNQTFTIILIPLHSIFFFTLIFYYNIQIFFLKMVRHTNIKKIKVLLNYHFQTPIIHLPLVCGVTCSTLSSPFSSKRVAFAMVNAFYATARALSIFFAICTSDYALSANVSGYSKGSTREHIGAYFRKEDRHP